MSSLGRVMAPNIIPRPFTFFGSHFKIGQSALTNSRIYTPLALQSRTYHDQSISESILHVKKSLNYSARSIVRPRSRYATQLVRPYQCIRSFRINRSPLSPENLYIISRLVNSRSILYAFLSLCSIFLIVIIFFPILIVLFPFLVLTAWGFRIFRRFIFKRQFQQIANELSNRPWTDTSGVRIFDFDEYKLVSLVDRRFQTAISQSKSEIYNRLGIDPTIGRLSLGRCVGVIRSTTSNNGVESSSVMMEFPLLVNGQLAGDVSATVQSNLSNQVSPVREVENTSMAMTIRGPRGAYTLHGLDGSENEDKVIDVEASPSKEI
ncbi:uncharacterized protein V1516DRAFT_663476 [Lipomyces oligophaga]|uniref:uncharacterized protein n=1 Tax=Lipomyces oligophaga TaxID=45792 RepID=UPI0034CEB74D